MDVDDAIGQGIDELIGQDLHVASQHYGVDLVGREQFQLAALLLGLGGRGDRQVMEFDPEALGDSAQVFAIADDERDFHAQFSALVSGQQIVEAVIFLGDLTCLLCYNLEYYQIIYF